MHMHIFVYDTPLRAGFPEKASTLQCELELRAAVAAATEHVRAARAEAAEAAGDVEQLREVEASVQLILSVIQTRR